MIINLFGLIQFLNNKVKFVLFDTIVKVTKIVIILELR